MYKQAVINSLLKFAAKTRREEYDEGKAYRDEKKEWAALHNEARESNDLDTYAETALEESKLDADWRDAHPSTQAQLSTQSFYKGPMRRRFNGNTAPRINEHDPSLNVLPGLRGDEIRDRVDKYRREHPTPQQVQTLKDQVEQYKQQNDTVNAQLAKITAKNRSKGETIANMRNDIERARRNAAIGGAVTLGGLGAIGGLHIGDYISNRMKWKGRKALAAQLIGAAGMGALGAGGGYYIGRNIDSIFNN